MRPPHKGAEYHQSRNALPSIILLLLLLPPPPLLGMALGQEEPPPPSLETAPPLARPRQSKDADELGALSSEMDIPLAALWGGEVIGVRRGVVDTGR